MSRCELEHLLVVCYATLGIRADALQWGERACANIDDILLLRNAPAEEKCLKQLKGRILSDVTSVYVESGELNAAQKMLHFAAHLLQEHGDTIGHAKALLTSGCIQ